MTEQKKTYPVIHIGTSLLLVIFIVLCLVTFAALSLSSALRDQEYGEKEAVRTAAYYEANGAAEEKLSEIIRAFEGGSLGEVAGITFDLGNAFSDEAVVSYEVTMNQTQTLSVRIRLSKNQDLTNGFYQILKWREVSTESWEGDDTLPVMGSE